MSAADRRWVPGILLSPRDQQHVLSAFVHRFTKTHVPAWAKFVFPDGRRYKPQFKDDQDWLANTRFAVTQNGSLDMRVQNCESTPTWPDGEGFYKEAAQ